MRITALRITALLTISSSLFLFNNCTGQGFTVNGNITSFSSTGSFSLDGSGIKEAYASNCTPMHYTDFLDSLSWSVRRIEPRDCAIVSESTPVFTWTQPTNRDSKIPWTLTISTVKGSIVLVKSSSAPRLILANSPLEPGNYIWNVKYQNLLGSTVVSSERRFQVSLASRGNTLPDAITVANLTRAKPHPRSLPIGTTFFDILNIVKRGEYANSFNGFITYTNKYKDEPIPDPPPELTREDFSSDIEYNKWILSLMNLSGHERTVIEDLAYMTYLTGDASYSEKGLAHLINLAAWPTNGVTSEKTQDQANREIYLALAMGLDLYHDKLSSSQISAIVTTLKDRITQAMDRFPSLDTSPYNSHLITNTSYVASALLYALDAPGFSESFDWLQKAYDIWITAAGVWGAEGQWGNSTPYNWFNFTTTVQAVARFELLAQTDLTRWSTIGRAGLNLIALTAPVTPLETPFGDGTADKNMYAAYSYNHYRLYAALTRNSTDEWYWRAKSSNIDLKTLLNPLHYLLLGLKKPAIIPTAPKENSFAFEDAGLVAIHSSTKDPNRSSLFFRSSRLGSFNHSAADQNSFVFVSNGYSLFINGGYYPFYNSPHHALVGRATRFKNALTFDGGIGQAEPISSPVVPDKPVYSADARGQLINFADRNLWAVATGDATLAYRGQDPASKKWSPLLNAAIRSVAYNRKEKVAIIYDWASSSIPRTWELNFQTLNPPAVIDSALKVTNSTASGCVDVYNLPGNFTLSKGFPIAPEDGSPDQFQARYSSSTKSTELISITIIREDCRMVPVNINFNGTLGSVSINNGSSIVFDRKTVTLQ